jgi:hypothetical protein
MAEDKKEKPVKQEEAEEEEDEDLFFTNARVVRLIRQENPKKIIKKRVKVEMNKLLEQIGRSIAKDMAKKPYASITYADFLDAARPYLDIQKITQERKKVIATLEKIKEDAVFLATELAEKTEETEY